MRKTILLAAVSALLAAQGVAQDRYEPVSTAPPTDARYEIIQTSRQVRETYLLNRFSGLSCLLVKKDDGGLIWQYIHSEPHLGNQIPEGGYDKPAYQILISGVDANEAYMINTETGATWALRRNGDSLLWGVVEGDSASRDAKRQALLEEIRNQPAK